MAARRLLETNGGDLSLARKAALADLRLVDGCINGQYGDPVQIQTRRSTYAHRHDTASGKRAIQRQQSKPRKRAMEARDYATLARVCAILGIVVKDRG